MLGQWHHEGTVLSEHFEKMQRPKAASKKMPKECVCLFLSVTVLKPSLGCPKSGVQPPVSLDSHSMKSFFLASQSPPHTHTHTSELWKQLLENQQGAQRDLAACTNPAVTTSTHSTDGKWHHCLPFTQSPSLMGRVWDCIGAMRSPGTQSHWHTMSFSMSTTGWDSPLNPTLASVAVDSVQVPIPGLQESLGTSWADFLVIDRTVLNSLVWENLPKLIRTTTSWSNKASPPGFLEFNFFAASFYFELAMHTAHLSVFLSVKWECSQHCKQGPVHRSKHKPINMSPAWSAAYHLFCMGSPVSTPFICLWVRWQMFLHKES